MKGRKMGRNKASNKGKTIRIVVEKEG